MKVKGLMSGGQMLFGFNKCINFFELTAQNSEGKNIQCYLKRMASVNT